MDEYEGVQEQDPRTTRAIVETLSVLPDLQRRIRKHALVIAPEGSSAAADIARPLGGWAVEVASAHLVAALDHLITWRHIITTRFQPTFAHVSLMRTAFESAVTTSWLLDRRIDSDERRARGVAAGLKNLQERAKVELALGITEAAPPAKTATERIADLMSEADRLGMTATNQAGRSRLSVVMPTMVDLFDRYTTRDTSRPGSVLYRLSSGFAHGQQWALLLGGDPHADLESGRVAARIVAGDTMTVGLTMRVVDATTRAVEELDAYSTPR